MSVHINIRIPDEQAAAIDALGKSRSQAIIEALRAYLNPAAVIAAPPMSPEVVAELNKVLNAKPLGKVTAMGGMRDSPKRLKPVTALVRTPKKVFGPSRIEAALPTLIAMERCLAKKPLVAHAPGCKCLMCQGK